VCIAADFTRYDGDAVQQTHRNIEPIRSRRLGQDRLLFELANASSASMSGAGVGSKARTFPARQSEAAADPIPAAHLSSPRQTQQRSET